MNVINDARQLYCPLRDVIFLTPLLVNMGLWGQVFFKGTTREMCGYFPALGALKIEEEKHMRTWRRRKRMALRGQICCFVLVLNDPRDSNAPLGVLLNHRYRLCSTKYYTVNHYV
jgi:hypothetical protein